MLGKHGKARLSGAQEIEVQGWRDVETCLTKLWLPTPASALRHLP